MLKPSLYPPKEQLKFWLFLMIVIGFLLRIFVGIRDDFEYFQSTTTIVILSGIVELLFSSLWMFILWKLHKVVHANYAKFWDILLWAYRILAFVGTIVLRLVLGDMFPV